MINKTLILNVWGNDLNRLIELIQRDIYDNLNPKSKEQEAKLIRLKSFLKEVKVLKHDNTNRN